MSRLMRPWRALGLALCLLAAAAPALGGGLPGAESGAAGKSGFIRSQKAPPQPSRPGQRGSQVLALQRALEETGYLAQGEDGLFGARTRAAVASFQADHGLAPTGQADRDTVWLLFRKPKPGKGDTLMPYWYGGGSELIPWGAEFEVKDVRSGITFKAKRMMGVSHLDAEPVTSFDTLEMQRAYGGTWSWNRRPILLRYLGEVYAASMNGKPHSYDYNRMNAMDGHFCIHFFGSRIDGNQRIDDAHVQAAVEASLTRWEDPPTRPAK